MTDARLTRQVASVLRRGGASAANVTRQTISVLRRGGASRAEFTRQTISVLRGVQNTLTPDGINIGPAIGQPFVSETPIVQPEGLVVSPLVGAPSIGEAAFFAEGFETYSTLAEVGTVWVALGTLLSFDGVRTGTHGLVSQGIRWDLGAGQNGTVIAAGGFRSLTDSAFDMIRFLSDSGTTEHIVIRRVAGGAIAVDRGSTQIAITAAGVFPLGTIFVEVRVVLHDTVGSVEIRINGSIVPVLTFVGDTKNDGTKFVIDSVAFHGLYDSANGGIDDLYIANGAGAAPYGDFLGNIRLWPLHPDGDGNSSQWLGSDGNNIDNWALVNDELTVAAMNDTVESRTPGDRDIYTYSDVGQTAGTIFGLRVATLAKGLNTSTIEINRHFRPVVRTGGVDYPGADVLPGQTASVTHEQYTVNPATGLPWTLAEINALEAGMEVRP